MAIVQQLDRQLLSESVWRVLRPMCGLPAQRYHHKQGEFDDTAHPCQRPTAGSELRSIVWRFHAVLLSAGEGPSRADVHISDSTRVAVKHAVERRLRGESWNSFGGRSVAAFQPG